ncbi:hypothetical protein ABT142_02400 [Streptomyces sp. NPDC001857]
MRVIVSGGTDIRPQVRTFPASDCAQASAQVRKGGVRYRAVVEFE